MSFSKEVQKRKYKGVSPSSSPSSQEPLWKGPREDGITYSLLSRWLVCRERFRILTFEGLRTKQDFNHRLEFGHLWHHCEEATAAGKNWPETKEALLQYATQLIARYPLHQEEVEKWYQVVKIQYPIYLDYWKKHPDVVQRQPIFQEKVFDVPYTLPTGRKVRLRGRWDSVDFVDKHVYLQENKTKGQVDPLIIQKQLTFDLQTMLYLTALEQQRTEISQVLGSDSWRINGVRYNVVRRPLSGGKGSIVQKKTESRGEYYARLAECIRNEPHEYFYRWRVEVPPCDLKRFRKRCLEPILEQLYDWWEWTLLCWKEGREPWGSLHWQHPYGVWNILNEGGASDLDEYLESGSRVGLEATERLFRELEED
jgi:hypothetical protein